MIYRQMPQEYVSKAQIVLADALRLMVPKPGRCRLEDWLTFLNRCLPTGFPENQIESMLANLFNDATIQASAAQFAQFFEQFRQNVHDKWANSEFLGQSRAPAENVLNTWIKLLQATSGPLP